MKMNILKTLSLLTLAVIAFNITELRASSNGNPQPTEEEGKKSSVAKKPDTEEKIGRETAKAVGDVEKGARKFAHGFKKQRHKDKHK